MSAKPMGVSTSKLKLECKLKCIINYYVLFIGYVCWHGGCQGQEWERTNVYQAQLYHLRERETAALFIVHYTVHSSHHYHRTVFYTVTHIVCRS